MKKVAVIVVLAALAAIVMGKDRITLWGSAAKNTVRSWSDQNIPAKEKFAYLYGEYEKSKENLLKQEWKQIERKESLKQRNASLDSMKKDEAVMRRGLEYAQERLLEQQEYYKIGNRTYTYAEYRSVTEQEIQRHKIQLEKIQATEAGKYQLETAIADTTAIISSARGELEKKIATLEIMEMKYDLQKEIAVIMDIAVAADGTRHSLATKLRKDLECDLYVMEQKNQEMLASISNLAPVSSSRLMPNDDSEESIRAMFNY